MGFLSAFASLISLAMMGLPGPAPTTTRPTPAAPPPAVAVWPLEPARVAREFSPPEGAWTAGHRGVDLVGVVGAPVVASLAGTVTFAGSLAGRGVVVIGHGDTRTTYEPLIPEVKRGDVVSVGTRIGTLDVTQSHCFPAACLHWGWLRGDEYLDPLDLIAKAAPVRLLPFTRAGEPAGRRP